MKIWNSRLGGFKSVLKEIMAGSARLTDCPLAR
jgi:hypothetical protein